MSPTLMTPCFDTWDRQGKGFAFISEKSPQGFRDHGFRWPDDREKMLTFVKNRLTVETNLYWAPLLFQTKRRDETKVIPGNTLFADLDPVNPAKLDIRPTVAWESSSGRYQALWWLDEKINPGQLAELNRSLTYHIGADKGGWDLTQVLRIPDTPNYKYNPPIQGKLLWAEKSLIYNKETFRGYQEENTQKEKKASVTLIELLSKYRRVIPTKVSHLLQYPPSRIEEGHRSDILWYIESELVKAQIPMEDIATLVMLSSWNKYKGRRDEWKRITTEISKVYEASKEGDKSGISAPESILPSLPWKPYGDLMSGLDSQPGWLIRDLWMRKSHGMVAGEPKTFKSTIALDMAVSVASGVALWGQFPVEETGPVLIVQNENAEWIIRDRVEKMIHYKNLGGTVEQVSIREMNITFPRELPMYFLNNYGYSFSDPLHREELEAMVEAIKPVLIVFDPLYLMFEGEINSAKDLQPVLFWLLELKNRFRTAVMVIHHWNKSGSSSRGGQRMLGSTTLHGWTESALYIQNSGEEATIEGKTVAKVSIEREFRAAGIMPKIELQLSMGEFGDPFYSPNFCESTSATGPVELMDLLSIYPNGLSISQASKELGVSRRRLTDLIMKTGGKVKMDKGPRNSSILRLDEEGKGQ